MEFALTLVKILVGIFTIIGIWVTLGKAIGSGIAKWNQHRQAKALKRESLQGHYDAHIIESATRYYVWPKCSNVAASHEAEIGQALVATREGLREKIDEFLEQRGSKRHLLILSGSGTGKTSFLLNYFAHNLRRKKRDRRDIQLVHLGSKDCEDRIQAVKKPAKTVLFLDALDEDLKAVRGHKKRIAELMALCREFSHVVITCRTQFFPSEEEIPSETGIVKVGPIKAGESGAYKFWRLYISPLDDAEVRQYISRRYPFWQYRRRKQATALALKIPLLSARPMLLAHIPDIMESGKEIRTVSALYEAMVDAWLERESYWVDKSELRRFSELLAVEVYTRREERGGEGIKKGEMTKLAKSWDVGFPQWQMTGRSFLNRDADGVIKFAHRSIMEYFVACAILEGRIATAKPFVLTDGIVQFVVSCLGPLPMRMGGKDLTMRYVKVSHWSWPSLALRAEDESSQGNGWIMMDSSNVLYRLSLEMAAEREAPIRSAIIAVELYNNQRRPRTLLFHRTLVGFFVVRRADRMSEAPSGSELIGPGSLGE